MNLSKFLLGIILIVGMLVRVWNINSDPPGLYWDEMDAGYQAYSILKTGKDYYGNPAFPLIHSFADYRAPGYIYSLIPFVAVLGLTPLAVRLPAALFGVLSIFFIYILAKTFFKSEKAGLVAALLMCFSPWNIQYSRMGFEITLMITAFLAGLISFLKASKDSRWFIVSGLLFSLSVLTYNTAKLFMPLICVVWVLIYAKDKLKEKNLILGSGIFIIMLLISVYSNFFLGGGQRFSEIAVWTDPQIATQIDNTRSTSALSFSDNTETGMPARFLDKLIYNKATHAAEAITRNYLTAFSPQFLFLTGDPILRHSPEKIGEFYRIEFLPLIFGIAFLLLGIKKGEKFSLFLLGWMILAPLPSVITREGGMHASRLAFMQPVLILIITSGIVYMFDLVPAGFKRPAVGLFWLFWGFGALFFLNYYFGAYKYESARSFQYGFSEAVYVAIKQTETSDYVIIDDRRDSALMNYLFDSKYDPKTFQENISRLPINESGFKASKIGKLIFLDPGTRDWSSIILKKQFQGNYAAVVSAEQFEEQTVSKVPDKLTKDLMLSDTIYYRNGDAAFYVISHVSEK